MPGEFVAAPQGVCDYDTVLGTLDGFPATVLSAAVLGAAGTVSSDWFRTRPDPLNASATTLPVWHMGLRLVGYLTADQPSAAAPNGLILDETDDYAQAAFRSTGLGALVLANDILRFNALITGLWCRLRYVNGAVAQTTTFNLVAWLEGSNA